MNIEERIQFKRILIYLSVAFLAFTHGIKMMAGSGVGTGNDPLSLALSGSFTRAIISLNDFRLFLGHEFSELTEWCGPLKEACVMVNGWLLVILGLD